MGTEATRLLNFGGSDRASHLQADSIVKAAAIDVAKSLLVIDSSTPPSYRLEHNARYLAFNLVSELDAPGE